MSRPAKRKQPDAEKTYFEVVADVLAQTWKQGRRALVVLGAGVSVAAKIPTMSEVFEDLHQRIAKLRELLKTSGNGSSDETESVLADLDDWLSALKAKNAPRSISAMALGMLQKAHEHIARGAVFEELKVLWSDSSQEFTKKLLESDDSDANSKRKRGIARLPTEFHKLVAEWAKAGSVDIISVNFGLFMN